MKPHPIPRTPLRMRELSQLPGLLPYAAFGLRVNNDSFWYRGFCMLRCDRQDVMVSHVGDVAGDGTHMPLFACYECQQEMRLMQTTWMRIRDGLEPPRALPDLNTRLLTRRTKNLCSAH